MKPSELIELGIPQDCVPDALAAWKSGFQSKRFGSKAAALAELAPVAAAPEQHVADSQWGDLAKAILESRVTAAEREADYAANPRPAEGAFGQWGTDIDDGAIQQMREAVNLPVAVAGALMPDAHVGYGLPIGGVLATHDAVIPYAVGVDIACRMKLTILDLDVEKLDDPFDRKAKGMVDALMEGTFFGAGVSRKYKANHAVMDRDWNITAVTKERKDRAHAQLGTSGSGNHFVEFGVLTLPEPDMGLAAGRYVALLSHSGSRGAGAMTCAAYVDAAKRKLPRRYKHLDKLAWLPMDSQEGQEYWLAMNLMGEYASANHAVIHDTVADLAGAEILATVENHHNFAWKETHGGSEVYVHRKGATPAGAGVPGVIPGSMADPAFVVRGKGEPKSLMSASHGAGRRMSRTQAIKTMNWSHWKKEVERRGVRLLAAGLDEMPGVYKPIREVMAAQTDLVDVVAQFDPKIVRMSDGGPAED